MLWYGLDEFICAKQLSKVQIHEALNTSWKICRESFMFHVYFLPKLLKVLIKLFTQFCLINASVIYT